MLRGDILSLIPVSGEEYPVSTMKDDFNYSVLYVSQQLEEVSSFILLKVFIMTECWIMSHVLSESSYMTRFFSLYLVMMDYIVWFSRVELFLHS